MTIVDVVIKTIGAMIILFCFVVLGLLFVEIAEALGYKIPNWIKKLKK